MRTIPTLEDIKAARGPVYQYLKPTLLYSYPGLNGLLGTETWIKHENHQPVGSFKIRGGLNLAANLSDSEKVAGLYTASTGNHGQSIAFAARAYGLKAVIAVPENANAGKVAGMEALGAKVVHHGSDFDRAREWIMEVALEKGGRFVSATEEELICGVGTYGLEIMEDLPEVDTIIVPVGAGSGACGTSIAVKNINPKVEIIAVQSRQAPAMQKSWKSGQLKNAVMNTTAEGLATRVPFENTQRIMRKYLDDFVLIDDQNINQAVYFYLKYTHNLAEEAGAAPLAAALKMKNQLAGKKVVLVLSGGNISPRNLEKIIAINSMND